MNPSGPSAELELGNRLARDVLGAMKNTFVGKDEIIDLLGISLVAGEHLFILGPPGTAKTALIHELGRLLDGSRESLFFGLEFGLGVVLPMLLSFEFDYAIFRHPVLNGAVIVATAFLEVSRIPTFSFKQFKVPQKFVLPTLLLVGLMASFLLSAPWAIQSWIAVTSLCGRAASPKGILAPQGAGSVRSTFR